MSEENLFEVSGSEMTDYSQKHAKLAPHFLGYRNVNSTEDSPLRILSNPMVVILSYRKC